MLGFYDEALGLIRGIGELSNIVILAAEDPQAIQEWINADAKTLKKKFKPMDVRKLLEDRDSQLMYATKAWYAICRKAMSTLRLEPSQMTTVDGHGLVVRFRRKALTKSSANWQLCCVTLAW
jgi:hypothetical protein